MKALQHFLTITRHRHQVMKLCFGVGLYRQGILHDLSKYSWTEFSVGAKYYQGDRSPNDAERQDRGVSYAWLHHKGRNKHHLEYWVDYDPTRQKLLAGAKMPVKYVVEMYCDRVAACKIYHKDAYSDSSALEYFDKGRSKELMHPESAALLRDMLSYLAEHGEKATSLYIRKEILHNKR